MRCQTIKTQYKVYQTNLFSGVVDIFISSHQLLSLTKAKNVIVLVQTNEIC